MKLLPAFIRKQTFIKRRSIHQPVKQTISFFFRDRFYHVKTHNRLLEPGEIIHRGKWGGFLHSNLASDSSESWHKLIKVILSVIFPAASTGHERPSHINRNIKSLLLKRSVWSDHSNVRVRVRRDSVSQSKICLLRFTLCVHWSLLSPNCQYIIY